MSESKQAKKKVKPPKFKKIVKWGFMAGCALGFCVLMYGCYAAKQLECNDVEISQAVMPGLGGLKIGQISDIHADVDMLEKAVDMVLAKNPDIVVLTGDLIDATKRVARTRNYIIQLKRLSAAVPTYACLGNHDEEKAEIVARIYKRSNVTLLRNQRTVCHIKRLNKDLMIAGIGDWYEDDFFPELCLRPKVTGKASQEPPVLLLCHSPIARTDLKGYSWNLMLGGHTHGGQMRYPFTETAIFKRDDDPYMEGYLPFEGSGIFISRGAGSSMGIRFFCPPEVNVLIVR